MAPKNTRHTMTWAQVASSSTTSRGSAPSAPAQTPPTLAPAPSATTAPRIDADSANIYTDEAGCASCPTMPAANSQSASAVPASDPDKQSAPPSISEATTITDPRSLSYSERLLWALQNDARLVAVDVEKYMGPTSRCPEKYRETKSPSTPTEAGISVSDPLILPTANRLNLTERILQSEARHVRVKEYCHLTNPWRSYYPKVCKKGCEEHFQFGLTEFASETDTGRILREIMSVPLRPLDSDSPMRPVALLLHAAGNDSQDLMKLGVDLSEPEWSHVFIVDTQRVARRRTDGNLIGLKTLCEDYSISYDHAHNSGNDAFRTLVVGMVDGMKLVEEQSSSASESDVPPSSDPDQGNTASESPQSEDEPHPPTCYETVGQTVEDVRARADAVEISGTRRTGADASMFDGVSWMGIALLTATRRVD
ncbi:uncharacterized protein BKCO1_6400026 [Diplodia corticola]|uniref:Gfd2/YDR514C-like C-terminal domain-containing protein n=1 Tax=Diplodia corticola TaxID=236234 RepID=A0A1J9RQM4_9PEZI|nr:uncharacterized protein BKCO1_6400026 [Diplodia corticola]OJD30204.1 hypothetical protein BKCO1_6400026 [Diplodia corticola]